ncbi:ankyrin repeat containing protein, putative [Babesia ovis]|uniref:Ankyrin repeat containing protein, putative n=1 Tax=Babesia ovis TaxID=5869 RepID=A0A9W5WWC9_BABOV|nr:ankyrin repeat containing protein, putative [Babesia ovis]
MAAKLIAACLSSFLAAVSCGDNAVLDYESRYNTRLTPLPADESYDEPLRRLAFGSCQKLHFGDNRVFQSIIDTNPDLFLYTGDIVYPDYGCCRPECLREKYEYVLSHPAYQHFKSHMRRIDGVYDDHDLGSVVHRFFPCLPGINDGHANYRYRKQAQQQLLDFFDIPSDHYRRRREGSYFSIEYTDPASPNRKVKVIVLDMRYHRDCLYYCTCQRCNWRHFYTYVFVFRRALNYYFGCGCEHEGDTLGEDQWRWLQGQLYNSTADAHIFISSIQVFTKYPIVESWGLLPHAKDRLVNLLLATKPKNPIFISGDVHWGEIMESDGIVEITSSSLTHAFFLECPMAKIPVSLVAACWGKKIYGYNNFGLIDFNTDAKTGNLTLEVMLLDENGNMVFGHFNDGSKDPLGPYTDVDRKTDTFLRDTRVVQCTSLLSKFSIGLFCLILLYSLCIVLCTTLRVLFPRRRRYADPKVD